VRLSLSALLDDVLELQTRRIQLSQVTLEKRYYAEGLMQGFPVEIRQVFLNLISNAIQAMPNGGKLRVSVRETGRYNGSAAGVAVSIIDTGAGIRPEDARHLFEPFFSTKSEKGTGLGLWISRGIVQKYEGNIRFRSVRSGGESATCFRIFIPLTRVQAAQTTFGTDTIVTSKVAQGSRV